MIATQLHLPDPENEIYIADEWFHLILDSANRLIESNVNEVR